MELTLSQTRPARVIQQCRKILKNSYAPYSNFHVACLLKDEQNRWFQGINIENASYGAALCAERSALAAFCTAGAKRIREIYIYHSGEQTIFPCGICLQSLSEFQDNANLFVWDPSRQNFLSGPFDGFYPFRFKKNQLSFARRQRKLK